MDFAFGWTCTGVYRGDRFSIVARDAWIEIITLSAKPVIAHLIFRRSYLRTSIYINRVVAHFVSFCFYQLVGRITWRDRLTRNFKKDADTIGDRHRDKLPFATANIFDWTGQLKFIESPSRSLPKFAQSMRIIDAPFFLQKRSKRRYLYRFPRINGEVGMKQKLHLVLDRFLSLDLTMRTAFPRNYLTISSYSVYVYSVYILNSTRCIYIYLYIGTICQPRI